jgi:hypothetical protein
MKYTIFTILLALTVFSGFSQAANFIDREGVRVEVLQFRELNDSLRISYSVEMDARTVARYQGLNITPGVETEDSLILLPSFTVVGDNKRRVLVRYYHNNRFEIPMFDIDWKSETSFIYHVSVPYREWMDDARLSIRQEVTGYRGHNVFTHFLLSDRVELESREPYQVQTRVAMQTPEKAEKILDRSGRAFLDFPSGRSVIQPNFRRNPEELRKIEEAVREVATNPDAQLQSIFIEGFASPEGPWDANDRLSRARAIALKDYIRIRFNFPESYFTVRSVAEDWDGLVALIQESNLIEKDRVLQIIATIGIFEGREKQLMDLAGGNPWRVMLRDMFPELRRVEYQINYTVREYSLQDAILIIDRNPGNLSHLEMFQVAKTFGRDSDRFNSILLETVLRYFPGDEVANLNAAALMIERGELTTAARHLEQAGHSAAALNNRGIIALLGGNLDEADSYFSRSQAAGSTEAAHNRNEVSRKREDDRKMERFRNR